MNEMLLMKKRFNPVVVFGLILYAADLAVLLQNKNFEVARALIVLVLFGMILPALAWLATHRAAALSISVQPICVANINETTFRLVLLAALFDFIGDETSKDNGAKAIEGADVDAASAGLGWETTLG